MSDDQSVLRVEGVSKRLGGVRVLEDVSASTDAGTVTALVGPNGSGKTTLLRVVAGLARPDAGTVSVDADTPRAVGYLPQSPRLRPESTVAETLSFYASLVAGGVDPETATARVGLADVSDRRVGALSGGMVRLVGLAQALLGDPALLVLDEPTSSLDPAMSDHVAGITADLAASGRSVLLATHDLEVAREADRLLLIDRGRVVADDTPAGFRETYDAERLTDAFVAAVGTGLTVRSGSRATNEDRTDGELAPEQRAGEGS